MSERFYDAAEWADLPHHQSVCLYRDGRYAVTQNDVLRIQPARVRWITITGNGRAASILDGQPDNPLRPAQVRGFVRERKAGEKEAIIYTPRAWVAEYQAILNDFGHGELGAYEGLLWWIATLDGIQRTPEEISADLEENYHTTLPAEDIWGNQWTQLPELGAGALVDVSDLYKPWR